MAIRAKKLINRVPLLVSILLIFTLLTDFGFEHGHKGEEVLDLIDLTGITMYLIAITLRYTLYRKKKQLLRLTLVDILVSLFLLVYLFEIGDFGKFEHPIVFYLLFFIVFIRELSTTDLALASRSINPALLFVGSFVFMVIMGALLLLLPGATYDGINFSNALFTSTSAVCVTGLIVVDTGSYFTPFGQGIILILIQLGGLGIMTFTSFFSFFFKGSSTFSDHMLLQDITKSEKVGEVIMTLKRIVATTLTVEAIAAILIYISLKPELFDNSIGSQIYFSAFHAISAFCNAGFSTLPGSLYEGPFRFLYGFHLLIAFTFIIGGLGFPIVDNLLQWVRYQLRHLFNRKTPPHKPWILHVNAKIILITTFILILVGTGFNLIFEYNHALAQHSFGGKIVTAFFAGTTPRTAGFNSIDMTNLQTGTILITIFLMWVGASPGSTGGGIKTTTFAVSIFNFISLARGKDRIEIFKREISNTSVRRAFATITLSIIVLAVGIFLLRTFDPKIRLIDTVFECFSAFSTVGLSLGITADLSLSSKFVLIFLMFIGRVGMLTILIAFVRSKTTYNYRYPSENILIN